MRQYKIFENRTFIKIKKNLLVYALSIWLCQNQSMLSTRDGERPTRLASKKCAWKAIVQLRSHGSTSDNTRSREKVTVRRRGNLRTTTNGAFRHNARMYSHPVPGHRLSRDRKHQWWRLRAAEKSWKNTNVFANRNSHIPVIINENRINLN